MSEAIVRGQQGKEVAHLQRLLARAGHRLVVDGVFGPRTQAAVATFLRARGRAGTGASVDAELLELLEQAAMGPGRGTTRGADASRGTSASWPRTMLVDEERSRVDRLGVRAEAQAFARLVCSRRTGTPLSVGLFGDWGSGKSFFMSQLQREIEARSAAFTRVGTRLRDKGDEAGLLALQQRWHGRVAQITFNAWHFAEPNLWASLITRVFDELAAIVSPAEPVEDTRARLLAEVSEGKQRREQAKLELREAEAQLAAARAERERREAEVARVREELAVVEAVDPAPPAEGDATPRLSVRGPVAALRVTLRWVWSRGRWTRVLLVGSVILTLVGAVLAMALWRGWWKEWLDPSVAMATTAAGVGTGLASTLWAWWTFIQPIIDQTRAAHAEYLTQRSTVVDRALRDLMRPTEGALATARQRMEEAAVGLDSAKMATDQAIEKVARARRMLQELEGTHRFYAFVRDRDEGDDYRRHLGVVSMVRDDFARLEQILDQVEREGPADGELAPLSRIVLYVDDLDRCEPARVVEVLQALQLLLSTPIFVVVVAADVRWLRRSLALHYERLLPRTSASPEDEDESDPTPRSYLEKIFQIPFSLRPIDAEGFAALVDQVVQPRVTVEEMRTASERLAAVRQAAADDSVVAAAESAAKPETAAKTEATAQAATTTQPETAAKPEATAQPEATTKPETTVQAATTAQPAKPLEPKMALMTIAVIQREASSTTPLLDAREQQAQTELDADLLQDAALALDPSEIAFLQRLHVVMGSPRLATALVNTYRLLRAEIDAGLLPSFVADGSCRGVLTLLAIQVGRPRDAARLFDALHCSTRATLGEVLHELAAQTGSDRREARWQALAAAVREVDTADARVDALRPWTVRIRRFSFDPWPAASPEPKAS